VKEITLRIDGMHCGACIRRVTQALQGVNGVEVEEVRLGAARVKVADDSAAAPDLLASVARIGFSAHQES
jgi:copper chaperone